MNASSLTPIDETDHTQGPDDAPVTLIEYGDFECPLCGQAYLIVERLRRDYGDDLRFAFRHLPLNKVHPHAAQAAQAAEAAGAQDAFWAMHAALFEHQRALEYEDLKGYAEDLALDTERFARELDERVYNKRVQADLRGGVRAGANGTPTFFINGVRHDGDFDFDTLSQAITKAGA
ncbi:DSBA oxidoreductase [Salinisphaera sp. S4-8]|uniref:DsbA family protein n=1 Tax=Salinisphaera sp. S4-8 TaxID=633357 RepID=UPI0033420001